MRYELTDYEWAAIRPMLPSKARGVPRVDDRRVLNGICCANAGGVLMHAHDGRVMDMTQTGSEPLPPKGVLGPTFRPDPTEGSRSASAHIFIAPEI